MMSKYLIIENQDEILSKILPHSQNITYGGQDTDSTIHKWLEKNIPTNNVFEKIIIELRLGDNDIDTGLRVANHIRFSKFGGTNLLPIFIISQEEKERIITEQLHDDRDLTALILLTKSCQLLKASDLHNIESYKVIPLKDSIELSKEVLSKLRYHDVNDIRHQIANEWGVQRLAKIAGVDSLDLMKENKKSNSLYFKWLEVKFNTNELRTEEVEREEKKNYAPKLRGLKIVGMIDVHKY
jgi:hypothetical protein